MELTNSFLAGGRKGTGGAVQGAESRALDWSGLHARLSAAHAARRALADADSLQWLPGGDFSEWSHAVRPAQISSRRINLTDLTDGKAACSKAAGVAGHPEVGD